MGKGDDLPRDPELPEPGRATSGFDRATGEHMVRGNASRTAIQKAAAKMVRVRLQDIVMYARMDANQGAAEDDAELQRELDQAANEEADMFAE